MIKHIVVTQDDIDKGYIGSPYSCPVYLAVARVCKNIEGIYSEEIKYWSDGKNCPEPECEFKDYIGQPLIKRYLPSQVSAWIAAFDEDSNHPEIKPFEFDLEIPGNVKCD